MSSSRPTNPRSTHWRADIAVMSLVQDAIHSIVSSCIRRSDFPARKDRNPNAFLYLKRPDLYQQQINVWRYDMHTITTFRRESHAAQCPQVDRLLIKFLE